VNRTAAKAGCTCHAEEVSAVRELCPECLAAWCAWREEDDRQARLYAGYGDSLAEVA
jgi:hypothetical protein